MKKVFLKRCICSYCKKERDISGRNPSSVTNDGVDKTKHLSLRTLLFIANMSFKSLCQKYSSILVGIDWSNIRCNLEGQERVIETCAKRKCQEHESMTVQNKAFKVALLTMALKVYENGNFESRNNLSLKLKIC